MSHIKPPPSHDGEPLVLVIQSTMEHTDEHPFCLVDLTCPCHEDLDLIAPLAHAAQDGLMTPDEATEYVMGRTLQGEWA